jgi:hypothetical protein
VATAVAVVLAVGIAGLFVRQNSRISKAEREVLRSESEGQQLATRAEVLGPDRSDVAILLALEANAIADVRVQGLTDPVTRVLGRRTALQKLLRPPDDTVPGVVYQSLQFTAPGQLQASFGCASGEASCGVVRWTVPDGPHVGVAGTTEAPPEQAPPLEARAGDTRATLTDGTLTVRHGDDPPITVSLLGGRQSVYAGGDGRYVLALSDDDAILVDTATAEVRSMPGGGGMVAPDPSGTYVAVAGGNLVVWELAQGEQRLITPERVTAITWDRSCADVSCRLLVAGEDLAVWQPEGSRATTLARSVDVRLVAFDPADPSLLATAGNGGLVALWRTGEGGEAGVEVATGQQLAMAPGSTATVADEKLTMDDGALVSDAGEAKQILALEEGRVLVVDPAGGVAIRDTEAGTTTTPAPECAGQLLAASTSGAVYASVRETTVTICDKTGVRVESLPALKASQLLGAVQHVAVAERDDGAWVALTGDAGMVELADVNDVQTQVTLSDLRSAGLVPEITAVGVEPGGTVLAGLRRAGEPEVVVWPAGRPPTTFDTTGVEVSAVGFLEDGPTPYFATIATDGAALVQIFDAESLVPLFPPLSGLKGHVLDVRVVETNESPVVVGVATTPDGDAARAWQPDTSPERACAIVGRDLTPDEYSTEVLSVIEDRPQEPRCTS